ncbi:MAG: ABC transporter ATP-binding protein [Actinomycetota bacterium]|nr:ABC transporter ATP-binding protein [Actinomycetota bacterium]
MTTIEVKDLWVNYGNKSAVKGLTLSANEGEIVAILGRNGAGKSSAIETIEGYRSPSKGSVTVLGLDPIKDRKKIISKLGVMLQSGGIYPRLSPKFAISLYRGYYDNPLELDYLIELCDLGRVSDTAYRYLSGGEKQRLSLALAIVGKPSILFLDEPTAGVDAAGKAIIREAITRYAKEGATVLVTTHELNEAERLANRIVVIDQGQVVAEGSAEELRRNFGGKEIVFTTDEPIDLPTLSSAINYEIELIEGRKYRLSGDSSAATISALNAAINSQGRAITEVAAGNSSLEDVFLALTESQETAVVEQSGRRRRRR